MNLDWIVKIMRGWKQGSDGIGYSCSKAMVAEWKRFQGGQVEARTAVWRELKPSAGELVVACTRVALGELEEMCGFCLSSES